MKFEGEERKMEGNSIMWWTKKKIPSFFFSKFWSPFNVSFSYPLSSLATRKE